MSVRLEFDEEQKELFKSLPDANEFEVRLVMNLPKPSSVTKEVFEEIMNVFKKDDSYEKSYENYYHINYSKTRPPPPSHIPYKIWEKQWKEIQSTEEQFRVRTDLVHHDTASIYGKKSITRDDIEFHGFNLRISQAKERKLKEALDKEYKPSFERKLERTSFSKDNHKIECSIVINNNLTIPNSIPYTTYEIELEYNQDKNVIFFDDIIPVIERLVSIMMSIYVPSFIKEIICFQTEKIKGIMNILYEKMQVKDFMTIKGQAKNIKRKHLPFLDNYAFTNKLDGERKLLYITPATPQNVGFIHFMHHHADSVNKNNPDPSIFLTIQHDNQDIPSMFLDGEFENNIFHMFDVIYISDILIPSYEMPHENRMEMINETQVNTVFPFQKKIFYYSTLEENVKLFITNNKDSSICFKENDGFIFTPKSISYAKTASEEHYHLKYKFSSKLSLDFYAVQDKSSEYNYFLYSNDRLGQNYGNVFYKGPSLDKTIIECLYISHNIPETISGTWLYYRSRNDRTSGNGHKVIHDVFEDMVTPLTLEEMFPVKDITSIQYIIELNIYNDKYVFEHFYNQSIYTFNLIYKSQLHHILFQYFPAIELINPNSILDNLIRVKKSIPTDYEYLSLIFKEYKTKLEIEERNQISSNRMLSPTQMNYQMTSKIKQASYVNLYHPDELKEFHRIFESIFGQSEKVIFDVRQFKIFRENIICVSKHSYSISNSNHVSLPPLPEFILNASKFPDTIIDEDPSYDDYVTVGQQSNYSSLMPNQAPQVKKALESWIPYPLEVKTIIDTTSHIGVDTIHFTKIFPYSSITAYEIEPNAFLALRKNVKTFGLSHKITPIYGDSSSWVPTHKIDIIYMDPPWGGRDYIKETCLDLFMQKEGEMSNANKNVNYMIDKWMNTGLVSHFILKAPANFNKSYLLRRYEVDVISIMNRNKVSYDLIHLKPMIPFLFKPVSKMTLWSVPYITDSYDPIFMNTDSVLIQIPSRNIPKEYVEMNISYFVNVPFSYQQPQLINEIELRKQSVKNGFIVTEQVFIINDKYYLLFVNSKFNPDELPSSMDDMKRYHNLEKKLLILQYAKQRTVLDLGAGFGGDLQKYQDAKAKSLILVEPLINNMVTLKGRLDNMKEIPISKHITLVHALGQEFDKIKPYITKRVELVSSFFSLTFLFESKQILNGFLDTVTQSILEGGYFIGTMMEGSKTYKLLESVTYNDYMDLGSDIKIQKLYENAEPDFGMKIHIDINDSIVQKQTEYLAFFSLLQEELEKRQFVLIKKIDFSPPDKVVLEEQRTFSSLNVGFVFRYVPTRISYSINRAHENDTYEFINLYKETQLLIRTGVPSTYSFAHSYLMNSSNEYKISDRMTRAEMAEKIGDITLQDIPTFMTENNINIYVMDIVHRRPMKIEGYDISRQVSIMLLIFPDDTFEPIAVNINDVAVRNFPPFDPFITKVHRNMKQNDKR